MHSPASYPLNIILLHTLITLLLGHGGLEDQDIADVAKYQDTVDITKQDSANILVGVVAEDDGISRTIETIMETWGQSSSNIVFYSSNTGGGKEEEEEMEWAWHRKRHKRGRGYDNRNTRVVRVKSESSDRTTQLLPMLQHMYRNLLNRYDWFVLVPQNMYVQLRETETLLTHFDPSQAFVLGRPGDQDTWWSGSGADEGGGGRCEEGRGVVISRQLLREVGRAMGACEEGAWHCIYNRTKLKCHHNNQVRWSYVLARIP